MHILSNNTSQTRGTPKCCPLGVFTPLIVHNPTINNNTDLKPTLQAANPASQPTIQASSATLDDNYTNTPQPPTSGTYRAEFSNKGLCFFRGIISCPAPHELHHLTTKGDQAGTLPNGRSIISTLRSIANLPIDDPTIAQSLPNKPNHITYHHSPSYHNRDLIHADDGSAASIIREDIALQLGTPIYTLSNPVSVVDINTGQLSHNRVCYIQLELPHLPNFRAIILCIVKKAASMPFLLGSDDQATYHIAPQSDDRTIRIGPSTQPTGQIPYLPQEVWSQQLKKPSASLVDDRTELKRKADLANLLNRRTIEPIINILTNAGMLTSGKLPNHTKSVTVTRKEMEDARDQSPPAEGPLANDIKSYLHQQHLIQTPQIATVIQHERKHDLWRETSTSKSLLSSKTDNRFTDKAIADLTQQALQEGLQIFTGKTIATTSPALPDARTYSSIQDMFDNLRNLHILPTTEVDPEIAPEGNIMSSSATTDNHHLTQNPPSEPPPKLDVPTPAPTGNFMADSIFAFLASVSPTMNSKANEIAEELGSYHLEPEPVQIDNELTEEEPREDIIPSQQTSDQDTLTPNSYSRDWLSVYQGNLVQPTKPPPPKTNKPTLNRRIHISAAPIKTIRTPTKPTPTSNSDLPTIDEADLLTKDFVPLPRIAELNEILYNVPKLRQLQEQEQATVTSDPQRAIELEAELADIRATLCTGTSTATKPDDFPEELWKYVLDSQKPLVAARFALFPTDVRQDLLKEITEKLDISTTFGNELERFMRAQALANLDTFGYPDPFSPPTVPGYTFRIQTVHELPIYQAPPRFNQTETAFLDARLYELVNHLKVEPAPNSQHNCGLVLVPYSERIKATLTKWTEANKNPAEEMFKPSNYKEVATWYRLTNNLKALNNVTVPYRYPMPDQEDPKNFTKGSRFWSQTDIKDAFFCINLHPDDRDKTAFTTPRGRYRFMVMPQGAMNSPTFFSHVAQETFQHIPRSELLNFIDDTTNHSRTFKQHLITQQKMYDALRSKRLIMKVSKSHFLQDSMRCLGHIFNEFGHTPDPTHVKAIRDMATPTDEKAVRSFLGLLNFNSKYIPHYSDLVGPLNDLLRKSTDGMPTNVNELWDDNIHGECFRQAKIALTSAPCMLQIDITKPFTIHVDSCKNGRGPGAVLLQQNDQGDWRPVSYFSCRLRKSEHAWSATELEAMGLVYAIRYWSSYLKVQKFTAIVDHHALIWLVTRPAKTANGRILHWISDLQEYHFDLIHRAGSQHLDADAISRLLHYSDIAQIHQDSSDQVEPANGQVTHRTLVDAYNDMVAQRDYYLLLTSKTFLATNPQPPTLPKPIPVENEDEYEQLLQPAWDNSEFADAFIAEFAGDSDCLIGLAGQAYEEEDYESDEESIYEPESDQVQLHQIADQPIPNPLPVQKPKKKTTVQRVNTEGAAKKGRGRPKKITLASSVGPPHARRIHNFDIDHADIEPHRHILHKLFVHPKSQRTYEVILLCRDRKQGVVAYRRALDDDPPAHDDDRPWPLMGPGGIISLVEEYSKTIDSVLYEDERVPWPTNEADMRILQMDDPSLQPTISLLLEHPTEYFQTSDTKAFYLSETVEGPGALRIMDARDPYPRATDRVALPMQLRRAIISHYHDDLAHPGRTRTIDTIRRNYWWPGFREDIETYINSCQYCNHRKTNRQNTQVPIQEYPSPAHAFDIVHLDLTGASFPKSRRGNEYVLVLKCSLTRYVEIIAIPDKAELTIARVLVERIYCRHGAPGTIITDRGTEFINKLVKQVCILLNINRVSTTGANPRSNGLVEQHNATLKDMLAVYVNAHQDDWDDYLPFVAHAYNTTVNAQTGFTPFLMVYGREARQLCNEWIEHYVKNTINPEEYVIQLANALQLGWDLAGLRKPDEVAEFNKVSRQKLPFKEYQVGQRFYLRTVPAATAVADPKIIPHPKDPTKTKSKAQNVNICSALQHRWTGPYKIHKKFSPAVYSAIINGVERTIHASHMKNDPIGITLRANLPLPITQPTPMAPFQEREHVSMTLFTKPPISPNLQVTATQTNDQVTSQDTSNRVDPLATV